MNETIFTVSLFSFPLFSYSTLCSTRVWFLIYSGNWTCTFTRSFLRQRGWTLKMNDETNQITKGCGRRIERRQLYRETIYQHFRNRVICGEHASGQWVGCMNGWTVNTHTPNTSSHIKITSEHLFSGLFLGVCCVCVGEIISHFFSSLLSSSTVVSIYISFFSLSTLATYSRQPISVAHAFTYVGSRRWNGLQRKVPI